MSPELNATEVFPASKSLFIRALLAKSYFPELKIDSKASSDDVRFCQLAVHKITTQSGSLTVDAGAAGAVFRFLALRLSRIEGKHFIAGTPKLLTRGMNELEKTLSFLGAEVKKLGHGWEIYSQPHKWVSNSQKALSVNTSTSSQVASGVILNSWGLKEDFVLRLEGEARSESYLEMTLKLFDELGGKIKRVSQTEILIPAAQKVRLLSYQPEIDFSCVFSWVATKILHCSYKVHGIPALSLQGDAQFVEFLQNAGVAI